MKRFQPSPKPVRFEERVEQRGAAWLSTHPSGRPPAYWQEFRSQLADAFGSLCAYGVMYEPAGTVDHFTSLEEDRSKAYEWGNYRFAAGWINSSKQSLRSTQLLDPFEVHDDWFEVLLPSMQLVLTDKVPPELRERAQQALHRLHLDHDERIVRQRREWYRMFQDGELDLVGLEKKAPLIAAAIKKQAT